MVGRVCLGRQSGGLPGGNFDSLSDAQARCVDPKHLADDSPTSPSSSSTLSGLEGGGRCLPSSLSSAAAATLVVPFAASSDFVDPSSFHPQFQAMWPRTI